MTKYLKSERTMDVELIVPSPDTMPTDPEAGNHGPAHAHKLLSCNVDHTPPAATHYSRKSLPPTPGE